MTRRTTTAIAALTIACVAPFLATPVAGQAQGAEEDLPGAEHFIEARYHEEAKRYPEAVDALTRTIDAGAINPELYHRRGVNRFYAGDVAGSVEDFDAYLRKVPEDAPNHWQRGISLYYVDRFAEGAQQFEVHRTVNPDDVENAVWHFLCKARADGIVAAQKALFPFTKDARVPMKEIHALYAGEGSKDAVLQAARSFQGSPKAKKNALCYAHLYLGLYDEAQGNASDALSHIRLAATTYAMDHYMGRVAKVHLRLREKAGR